MKKTIKNIFGFKAFSVLLSLSLLLGALWCVPAFAEDEGTAVNVWDGKSAEFTEGTGSETDPYKITNGGQLFNMMTSQGKDSDGKALYYEITEDIYLNDVDNNTYKNDWVNNDYVNDKYSFIGNVDGNGHTIYGLYVNNKNKSWMGLFPRLGKNATVKNIQISKAKLTSQVNGSIYMGAVAAQISGVNVTISNCLVDSSEIEGLTDGTVVGGLVGNASGNSGLTITNCGFNGTLKKNGNTITAGGIVAQHWSNAATISNCYSIGAFPVLATGTNAAVNIKAYACTNVYTNISAADSDIKTYIPTYETDTTVKATIDNIATVLTSEQMTGANAKVNMSKFNFYTTWQAVENGYPVPRTTDCANYGGGDGTTKETAFEISTDAQLYKLATDNDTAGKYYKLIADITLNDDFAAAAQWVTAGDYTTTVFRGNLDGNGKTVRGLYVNTSGDANKYAGLFPVIGAGAVISNLTVKDANLYGTNNLGDYFFGVIAGVVNLSQSDKADASDSMKWPTIVACGVEDATVNARFAGGIIGGGEGYAKIESSYSANVNLSTEASTRTDGNVAANGIVGKSWNKNFYVKNCYTTYKTAYIGGQSTNYYVLESAPIDADGTIKASGLISGTFTAVTGGAAVPNANLEYVHVSKTSDADALAKIRSYILGDTDKYYIVDVNNNLQYVDICDLVYAALGE